MIVRLGMEVWREVAEGKTGGLVVDVHHVLPTIRKRLEQHLLDPQSIGRALENHDVMWWMADSLGVFYTREHILTQIHHRDVTVM